MNPPSSLSAENIPPYFSTVLFTNAAGKKQHKFGSLYSSSKGINHGFGLGRVKSTVEKYGGMFSADSEDGGFTAEILIPLDEEQVL